jgi:hypothetical protein
MHIDSGREDIPRALDSAGQQSIVPYSPLGNAPTLAARRDSLPPSNTSMVFTRGNHGLGYPTRTSQSSDLRVPMAPPPTPIGRMSLSGPSIGESQQHSRTSSIGHISPTRGHALPTTPSHAPGHVSSNESLRLPPLHGSADHGRSMESVILSMPFLAKIKILRRVVPPIKNRTNNSGVAPIPRGAIISVEGDKNAPLAAVLARLEDTIKRQGEFDVTILDGPKLPGPDASIGKYVEEVARWHHHAASICDMVLGPEFHPDERTPRPESTKTENEKASTESAALSAIDESNRMDVDIVSSGANTPKASTSQYESETQRQLLNRRRSTASQTNASTLHLDLYPRGVSKNGDSRSSNRGDKLPRIPLILIPCYLVGASNAWASALPIRDQYKPSDHWQWTATLWRGVPGPDFTIYVRSEEGERLQMEHAAIPSEWSPTGSKNNVEIKEEYGLMVIRTTKDGDSNVADQAAVRRVAFEVSEWARVASLARTE